MAVLTVTANSAIDVTLRLQSLEYRQFNRASEVVKLPGGKGNNVARILHNLGHDVVATGFVGGNNGHWIESNLSSLGISTDFITVGGESRCCYAILESEINAVTEIVEPGLTVDASAAAALIEVVRRWSGKVDGIVISGSLPAGIPTDFYAVLIGEARSAGATFVALDTSGDALVKGIAGHPDIIKPNAREIQSFLGATAPVTMTHRIRAEICPQLSPEGLVIISNGEHGILAVGSNTEARMTAPRTTVVNTVGCGDALLAGFVHSYLNHWDLATCLAFATACGTAASIQEVAGFIAEPDIERFLLDILLG